MRYIKGRLVHDKQHPAKIQSSLDILQASFAMASHILRVAFGLSLLANAIGVGAVIERPAKYTDEIPEAEKAALASVVEDNPDDIVRLFKDWESPEYPLIYRQALPIPPVKEPK
jgi:hypothetical protein